MTLIYFPHVGSPLDYLDKDSLHVMDYFKLFFPCETEWKEENAEDKHLQFQSEPGVLHESLLSSTRRSAAGSLKQLFHCL